MKKVIAIIPARAGSKGIPNKNLVEVCGKPLIAWSILQCIHSEAIDSVWVSSDGDHILEVAESFGAMPVKRPEALSNDTATSESAWVHAIEYIQNLGIDFDLTVGIQATSPIREARDFDLAIELYEKSDYGSLMSVAEIRDFFMWKQGSQQEMLPTNFELPHRPRRQEIDQSYLENGSFYLFRPEDICRSGSRFNGKIGAYVMAEHKMFQIDNLEDIELCSVIMAGYGMAEL